MYLGILLQASMQGHENKMHHEWFRERIPSFWIYSFTFIIVCILQPNFQNWLKIFKRNWSKFNIKLEFVTGGVELLKPVLHGYAGGLIFMK